MTQCNDSIPGSSRRRRGTEVAATQRAAENGPLAGGVLYSTFLRVYVLVDADTVMNIIIIFLTFIRRQRDDITQ